MTTTKKKKFLLGKSGVTLLCKVTFDPWKKSYGKARQHIKKQRHHFADKGQYSQSYGFSSNHAQMGELDHNEG